VLAAAPARSGWQPVEHEGRLGWVTQRYLRSVEQTLSAKSRILNHR